MKVPEQYRHTLKGSMLQSDNSYGNNGVFLVPLSNTSQAQCIASDGDNWEHVSVVINDKRIGKQRTPTWAEMCKIKALFWDDTETVIQYHPAKSDYVNNHKHCLHLWRPTQQSLPTPDPILVGIK